MDVAPLTIYVFTLFTLIPLANASLVGKWGGYSYDPVASIVFVIASHFIVLMAFLRFMLRQRSSLPPKPIGHYI